MFRRDASWPFDGFMNFVTVDMYQINKTSLDNASKSLLNFGKIDVKHEQIADYYYQADPKLIAYNIVDSLLLYILFCAVQNFTAFLYFVEVERITGCPMKNNNNTKTKDTQTSLSSSYTGYNMSDCFWCYKHRDRSI